MNADKKVAGIYIRVSTEDQAREQIQFRRAKGKIHAKCNFCTPIYFLTSTEFFLPSQNSIYGTKSQTLYKNFVKNFLLI